MKTFVSVGIGLVVGIIIGIAASFKAAEKKAGEIIADELAEERKSMREGPTYHDYAEEGGFHKAHETVDDFAEVEDDSVAPFEEVKETYENISGQYEPAKKPYILEDKPVDFAENHPFLNMFSELNVVYDRDRGRVADEDGCEVFDIKGMLGFNNLNRLFSDEKYSRTNVIHIVCERDGFIYIAHTGDLYEYLDEEYEGDDDE